MLYKTLNVLEKRKKRKDLKFRKRTFANPELIITDCFQKKEVAMKCPYVEVRTLKSQTRYICRYKPDSDSILPCLRGTNAKQK